jgi:hypothetical protein
MTSAYQSIQQTFKYCSKKTSFAADAYRSGAQGSPVDAYRKNGFYFLDSIGV